MIVLNVFFSPITNPDLFERGEIVALFNTFNRFSESVHGIKSFRNMYIDKMTPKVKIWPDDDSI